MNEKILIVYLHGIGDHLMAMPAIHAYKQKHPSTEISLLSLHHPVFNDLWKHNPDIKEVLFSSLRRNPRYGSPFFWLRDYWIIRRDIRRLQRRHHFSHVYFIVHFFMPGKIYPHLPIKRYSRHKSEIVAAQLGIPPGKQEYRLHLTKKERRFAKVFFSRHRLQRKKVICIHSTASSKNKSFTDLEIQQLTGVLLSSGFTPLFVSHLPAPPVFRQRKDILWYSSTNILQTAALLERSHAFIGVDSGIAHLASAVGTRSFVVYMNPLWIKNSSVLDRKAHLHNFARRDFFSLQAALRRFLR